MLTPGTSGANFQAGTEGGTPSLRRKDTAVTVTKAHKWAGRPGSAAGHLFALGGAWCVAATAQAGSVT
jgi:hypothetical protein